MSDIGQLDGCDSVSDSADTSLCSIDISDSSSVCSSDTNTSYRTSDKEFSTDSNYSYIEPNLEDIDDQSSHQIQVVAQHTHDTWMTPPVWFEQYIPRPATLPPCRKTLKRDNKFEKCGMLPTMSVPNARSLFPKINGFIHDMNMRSISVAVISETWQKESKKSHKNEVERMLHMEGIKFISTARPGGKRGGGCAIVANTTHYTLDQLDIPNPDKVEMCWAILRPKQAEKCVIKEHIFGSFYCPPNSRKKEKLTTHIITNAHA